MNVIGAVGFAGKSFKSDFNKTNNNVAFKASNEYRNDTFEISSDKRKYMFEFLQRDKALRSIDVGFDDSISDINIIARDPEKTQKVIDALEMFDFGQDSIKWENTSGAKQDDREKSKILRIKFGSISAMAKFRLCADDIVKIALDNDIERLTRVKALYDCKDEEGLPYFFATDILDFSTSKAKTDCALEAFEKTQGAENYATLSAMVCSTKD